MLTSEHVETFRREGTITIRGLVPPEVLRSWRAQFWGACRCDPDEPTSWPGAFAETNLTVHAQASTNQPENPLQPALGHLTAVREAVHALGGGGFAEGQRPRLSQREKAAAGLPLSLPAEPIDHFLAHWGWVALRRPRNPKMM